MNPADRKRWAAARTLAGIGALTALWLEGAITSQPAYADPAPGEDPGPDPETRGLVPVLAACNRAGFVTSCSQPGEITGSTGWPWKQRAAVEGFADGAALTRLRAAVAGTSVILTAQKPRRWRCSYSHAVPVSAGGASGRTRTSFGVCLSRRHLADSWTGYGVCHRDGVKALQTAWQVALIDPEWGRNDLLWPLLAAFTANTVMRAPEGGA